MAPRHRNVASIRVGLAFAAATLSLVPAVPAGAEPVVQELPGTGAASRLADALRVLTSNDTDVPALIAAGQAALELQDAAAAYGFFARAQLVSPRNPQVEVGLGRTLVLLERADEALLHFAAARSLGADERTFAGERGLANDIRGDFGAAQADYRIALSLRGDDEVARRLALSQAIGGDARGALATLAPLVARGDAASWRARAFILAMDGDLQGARGIASARMSPGMAGLFDRFFSRLPTLNPAERARAVHFGDMPADGARYASVRAAGDRLALATNTQPPPRSVVQPGGRAAGGALIPRGAPPVARARVQRSTAPDRRTALGRTVRQPRVRVAAAPVAKAQTPPPLPTPFSITLPAVVSATPQPAAALPQRVASNDGAGVGPLIGGGSLPAVSPIANAGQSADPVPGSARVGSDAITRVDPDTGAIVRPGDMVYKPDDGLEVSSAPERLASSTGSSSAESLKTGDVRAPETLLSQVTVRQPSVPLKVPRPGFAEPVRVGTIAGADGTAVATASPSRPPVAPVAKPLGKPRLPERESASTQPKAGGRSGTGLSPKPAPVVSTSPTGPSKPAKTPGATTPKASPVRPAVGKPDKAKAASDAPIATKAPQKVGGKAKATGAAVPERYWFQVATGGNANALVGDLSRLQAKHKSLAKFSGFTAPFGKSRRLVVGPFASLKEAKAFEAKAKVDGVDGYVWVSPEGFTVEPLPAK